LVLLPLVFTQEENDRQRQMSLFTVVNFPNDECTTKSSATTKGVCFTNTECVDKGGLVDGNCAAGFGVCCHFKQDTCGSSFTQNCTYLQNPSYPATYTSTSSCSYSVTPMSNDICQFRLDFNTFDITDVTTIGGTHLAGTCTDQFTMTGPTGRNPDTLCGTLTGHHVYVENGRSTSATTFAFTQSTAGTWNIKVSQIECTSHAKAPIDCNQYLTGVSGTITSYNWPQFQLQSTNVLYCIRREDGMCGISYAPDTPVTNPSTFNIGGFGKAVALTGAVIAQDSTHSGGFITFQEYTSSAKQTFIIAGDHFGDFDATSDTVGSTSTQAVKTIFDNMFRLRHTVFGAAAITAPAIGFKLRYTQVPCGQRAVQTTDKLAGA